MYKIPLSVPSIKGNEWKYIKECLDTEWVSSAGSYVDKFEQSIGKYVNSKYAVACVNGTSALQVSLRLAGVKPEDEVLVPTLTFIASVNAIAYNGAHPIFMDADNHCNLDVVKVSDFIKNETFFKNGCSFNKVTGKKISAIMPVHVWGNPVLMDDLVEICQERNITIIEDASESLGSVYNNGKYKGKHTGTIGKVGCFSFNGNKIITAGGGGIIVTNDRKLALKAHYLITQAKDDPTEFVHNEIGYNFRLTNIQAALGLAQLEQLPKYLKIKKDIYRLYTAEVNKIEGLEILDVPSYADNNHWMNILKINKLAYKESKKELILRFRDVGIEVRPIWKLNHLQTPYINHQNYKIDKSMELVKNSICLPSSVNLSESNIHYVIQNLLK